MRQTGFTRGFAAVDAIVALTLISIVIAFCLQAGVAASKASRMASELRQVEALSRYALASASGTVRGGAGGDLDWKVQIAEEQRPESSGPVLCRKQFVAVNRQTGRRYEWQAVSPCARTVLQ